MNNISETVAAKHPEGFCVDDEFLDAVIERLGTGYWDILDQKEICSEVIAEFLNRYKVVRQ